MNSLRVMFLFCTLCSYAVAINKLPSYIRPCSVSDSSSFDECATQSAREALTHLLPGGDPEYNVPVLDPLDVKELHAYGRGGVSISFVLKQATLIGLKNMQVKNIKFDFDGNKITFYGNVPLLEFHGNYKIDGKILLIPLHGQGRANINISDVSFVFTSLFNKETLDDGTAIQKFHTPNLVFKQKSAAFQFKPDKENKVLGSNLNQFFNDNNALIIDDLGPSFAKALAAVILDIFSRILDQVPYDDIFKP